MTGAPAMMEKESKGFKSRLALEFQTLRNSSFAHLYLAQTISLLGDAFTWVGLALLAFELGGLHSAVILSTTLTLRVTAFVIFSPYAGVLADRIDRKKIMYVTHLIRMALVGTLPFVTQIWQVYSLVFLLNVFNGFFTPAYRAAVPQVLRSKEEYPRAIALSTGTYELLDVLGPGIAGGIAAFLGSRQIFFIDAVSFIVAAVLIFTLPGKLLVRDKNLTPAVKAETWEDIKKGTTDLFAEPAIRFALIMEFIAAIAGAQILVNTIGHIKGVLHLSSVQYGWAMSALGIGAAVAAFSTGMLSNKVKLRTMIRMGAFLLSFAILPANYVGIYPLIVLWFFAGIGQSLVEIPAQTLIAELIPIHSHGKVYGAHFAWSHLWWVIAYPIAGLIGNNFMHDDFLIGGSLAVALIIITLFAFRKQPGSPKLTADKQR